MGELRKDYALDEWVIIATNRASRPQPTIITLNQQTAFNHTQQPSAKSVCYFCPGDEHLCPPEIGRFPESGVWQLRWFENKFPCVQPENGVVVVAEKGGLVHAPNYGFHELVVETREHSKQLWDCSQSELENVLGVYERRIVDLEGKPRIKYVAVTKNHGTNGGASIDHSHCHVVAVPIVPMRVQAKIDATKKQEDCPYCFAVEVERKSDRKIFENDEVLAFAPFAPRFKYEAWVVPKKHKLRLEEVSRPQLAEAMHAVLSKLRTLGCAYNHFFTYAPKGTDLHLHVEILPRIGTWAGFEHAGGLIVNDVAPEQAARFYRGES